MSKNTTLASTEQGKTKKNQEQDEDLGDLLQEMRILLQGAQVLTAFLIVVPFNEAFGKIDQVEKWVYLATFLCSVTSLILISAPAAQHRLARPLNNRSRFKQYATRITLAGLVPLSLALVLATQLVVNEVAGSLIAWLLTVIVGLVIGSIWWIFPLLDKSKL